MQNSGFLRRLAAFIIDCIFINVIVILGFIMIVTPMYLLFGEISWIMPLVGGIILCFNPVYFIFFHGRYGRTPGKKYMRLKVVSYPEGTPITLEQAFHRHSVDFFLILLCAFILVIVWTIYSLNPSYRDSNSPLSVMAGLLAIAASLWKIANCLTLLVTEHYRGLNDFIGNTIVIKNSSEPVCQERVDKALEV